MIGITKRNGDFFSDFGNQRELFQIVSLFDLFKKGEAKQLKKERAAALGIEDIVAKYANGTTKSGKESKSYTLLFPMTILRECEQRILSLGMEDLGVLMKSRNFKDIMGVRRLHLREGGGPEQAVHQRSLSRPPEKGQRNFRLQSGNPVHWQRKGEPHDGL